MTGTPFDDKRWRLEHCYEIVDKEAKRRTMTMNVVQQVLNACTSQWIMVLKARQFGVSTYVGLDYYDDTINIPNTTTIVLAHEKDAIEKLFRIPKRAYEFTLPELKPKIDRGGGSKYEMYFPKLNSRIYCDLESRGDTCQRLHISELAFSKDEAKVKATMETVPLKTGKIFIESTANGIGGMFYEYWNDPKSPYKKFFFPWYIFPDYAIPTEKLSPPLTSEERDFIKKAKSLFKVDITPSQIAFRRFKQSTLKVLYIQEYPEDDQTCFLASGSAAMNLLKLAELKGRCTDPREDWNGTLRVWREYDSSHRYVLGVDTAEGVGGDWSRAFVLDVTTKEQVALLSTHRMRPDDFADLVNKLALLYWKPGRQHPVLGVERNNHGHTVLLRLEQLEYPKLYHRPKGSDEKGNALKDDRPGWVTDKATRPPLIDDWIEVVEDETITIHDHETIIECMTLINNEGKIEANEGKHDDIVIAGAIAVQMMAITRVLGTYENIGAKIRV